MQILTQLILISLFWVFCLDISDFIPSMEKMLGAGLFQGKRRVYIPKPFCCSFCMTFWTCLLYIILTHKLSISHTVLCCVAAYVTPIEKLTLNVTRDAIEKLINQIDNVIQR